MSTMVKIADVPDSDDAKPGMAFFAGTGPAGKKCGDCKHRGMYRESGNGTHYRTSGCQIFKRLSGRYGPDVRKDWPSCKYFERKPEEK